MQVTVRESQEILDTPVLDATSAGFFIFKTQHTLLMFFFDASSFSLINSI